MSKTAAACPAPTVTPEQFDAMTPQERRVVMAKEILMLQDAWFLRPKVGGGFIRPVGNGPDLPDEAAEFLEAPKCEVCYRGALVVAYARLADRLEEKGLRTVNSLCRLASSDSLAVLDALRFASNVLSRGLEEWEAAEQVFEGWVTPACPRLFFARRRSATGRLRVLCEHVIATEGRELAPVSE
jgi:hypothetical protein